MKLIWLTDIHLNFLSKEGRMDFYQKIIATSGDKILISGDISEAPSVSEILKEMAEKIQKPIYFVHSKANWQPCDNLTVKAGAAEYTKPKIQEIIAQ